MALGLCREPTNRRALGASDALVVVLGLPKTCRTHRSTVLAVAAIIAEILILDAPSMEDNVLIPTHLAPGSVAAARPRAVELIKRLTSAIVGRRCPRRSLAARSSGLRSPVL